MFKKTELKLVMAKTRENIIGTTSGKLPWNYKEDMRFFKKLTIGNAVIMGSKTYESIGKLLTDRTTYILSKRLEPEDINNPSDEKFYIVKSIEELSELLEEHSVIKAYVVGGLVVYEELYKYCTKFYITAIPETACIHNNTEEYVYANDLVARMECGVSFTKLLDEDMNIDGMEISIGNNNIIYKTDVEYSETFATDIYNLEPKTERILLKAMEDNSNYLFQDNVAIHTQYNTLLRRIKNRCIIISTSKLPLDAEQILLPYERLNEVMDVYSPLHSLDTLDTSKFRFETLLHGYNVILLTAHDGHILLLDLLNCPERYTDKEITWDTDVYKMFLSGELKYYNPRNKTQLF